MDFDALLHNGEATWLDWKVDFPQELKAGARGDARERGKGLLLKDLVSIANGNDGRELGYLVYGVKDIGGSRQIIGIDHHLEDADVQTWSRNAFDPTPTFQYEELTCGGDVSVGVFEITRTPEYPHVCKVSVPGIFYVGQVWHRVGSRNAVAMHSDLAVMFRGHVPVVFERTDEPELKALEREFEDRGFRVSYARVARKESLLLRGRDVAHFPGTRREIVVGRDPANPGLVMMLERVEDG